MKPVSPVIPGALLTEVVIAEHQPEYRPLPAHTTADGTVLSRWKLGWRERLRVLFTGNLYLWVWAFGQPVQPVLIEAEKPKVL